MHTGGSLGSLNDNLNVKKGENKEGKCLYVSTQDDVISRSEVNLICYLLSWLTVLLNKSFFIIVTDCVVLLTGF